MGMADEYEPNKDDTTLDCMMDFYALVYMKVCVDSENSWFLSDDDRDFVYTSLDKLLRKMKTEYLMHLRFAINCEMHHALSTNYQDDWSRIRTDYYFDPYLRNLIERIIRWSKSSTNKDAGYFDRNKAFERRYKYLSESDMILLWKLSFDDSQFGLDWDSSYGGKAWYRIVEAYEELNNAVEMNDLIMSIDHINDIQHNEGRAFDKFWKANDVDHQFQDAVSEFLDEKRYANHPAEWSASYFDNIHESIRSVYWKYHYALTKQSKEQALNW